MSRKMSLALLASVSCLGFADQAAAIEAQPLAEPQVIYANQPAPPPPEMLARRPDLPRHMEGGPQNPLGARAMYLGSSLYRIHGSNEPWTIGTNVSSGCIRMRNEDVTDLYGRVNVGTKVIVM